MSTSTRTRRGESLRLLEQEVGVMIRRIRRVIWERARAVHPELQPASYLLLAHLVEQGPRRASTIAETLCIDKGALSRQLHHLGELGLVDRNPDPDDGRATLVSASADAVRRLDDVAKESRQWFDQRLGDWSDDEIADFARDLARYNAALDERA